MAVKLRLRRMGRKKLPVWAVIAADSRSPRDGRFIEDLGRYFPLEQPARVELNAERIMHWLEQGAQPSDTVRDLLRKDGLMLALHLKRKGKPEDEIASAVESYRADRAAKATSKATVTADDRRRQALEEEAKRVKKEEEERAKQKAQEEQEAREAAERAKLEAAEKRAEAAEAARVEQEAANKATAEEDAETAKPADGGEEAPANEPAPAKESGEESATEEAAEEEKKEDSE